MSYPGTILRTKTRIVVISLRGLCPENVGWAVPTTIDGAPVGTAHPTESVPRNFLGKARSAR